MTEKDLREIEAQIDPTVPFYVPTMIRAIRDAADQRRRDVACIQAHDAEIKLIEQDRRGLDRWIDNLLAQLQQVTQERDTLRGIASAHEAITRAIADAVGDGDPSGPYWEDGVRFLQERAETAEAEVARLWAALDQIARLRLDMAERIVPVNDFYRGVERGMENARILAREALSTPAASPAQEEP